MTEPVVRGSEVVARGAKIVLRRDTVDLGAAGEVVRDVIEHPGAVGIVAMDDTGRVLLLRQYRHPVAARLWEIPAGLLDVAGEAAVDAAVRELAEEGGVRAEAMHPLLIAHTSPGMTDERVEIFLAVGLSTIETPTVAEAEESDMEIRWVPLSEAAEWVDRGIITNAMAIMGILAAARLQHGREATP